MKCPACHSEALSPAADYAAFDNHARFPGLGGEGFLGAKDLTVKASSVRICLDCGYLLHFVDGDTRAKLRAAID